MKLVDNISVIILAGGNSSRMRYPKPWLKNERGITFLNEIITSYKQLGFDEVVVVLNEEFTINQWKKEFLGIQEDTFIVKNNQVEKGRLFSIQLGLVHSNSNFNILHNVDNPFVEYKVIAKLMAQMDNHEVIIPTINKKGGHPVIIGSKVKNEIIQHYHKYETLKDLFSNFDKKYVAVKSNSILTNINTPQDLEGIMYEPV